MEKPGFSTFGLKPKILPLIPLTSVGVINNEFGDNQELAKAFKRIYAPAYTEKRNALKYMSSSYINEEGNFEFLSGVPQETVDRVAEAFPDILLLYSLA